MRKEKRENLRKLELWLSKQKRLEEKKEKPKK